VIFWGFAPNPTKNLFEKGFWISQNFKKGTMKWTGSITLLKLTLK
jgi:hypothetical protein